MKASRVLLLAAAFAAAAVTARADFYAKIAGLYNSPADLKVDSASAFRGSLKNNLGYSGAIGYKFSLLRAEAEVQYFKNSLGGGSTTSSDTLTANGDRRDISGFLNAYVDVPGFFGLAPYFGAGVGVARVDLDNMDARQGGTSVVKFSGCGQVYGYQLMAGLQFRVLGKATLNAGYRLQHKEGFEIHNFASNLRQNVALGTSNVFELGLACRF